MDRADADGFPRDPRTPDLDERRQWLCRLQRAQAHWLPRLQRLCETAPAADFPAFLLATPAFAPLRARIGAAAHRADLGTATADELDHFVAAYRDYLRTSAGEDVFAVRPR